MMFDLQANWDEQVGLWRSPGPGHTFETKNLETIHAGPGSAARLVAAAMAERLDEVNVAVALRALRAMQRQDDDPQLGCIRWYWEETRPIDTNASFFTAMGLIPFYKLWADKLNAEDRSTLEAILQGFQAWFLKEVDTLAAFYPNKFLGDLVCAWMLVEMFPPKEGARTQRVAEVMAQSADYWRHNGWGWGEHLSDGYANVCLHELSMLLLLAENLPANLRLSYTGLLRELLAIEDAFGGRPRVPALRSYAHRSSPPSRPFRSFIEPWSDEQFARLSNMPPLGALWHKLNWHKLVTRPAPPQRDIKIACFGSAQAIARIEDDVRLGTVSRFPVMPPAEHRDWGLSWQCFPAAWLHRNGDWAFLQWGAVEAGVEHAHPANGGAMAHIPKNLTDTMLRPLTGQTRALQHGGNALVLRIMPTILRSWERVSDRLRLIAAQAPHYELENHKGWSQLLLHYEQRTLSIAYVDWMTLAGTPGTTPENPGLPQIAPNDCGGFDWQVSYDAECLAERSAIVGLWALSLDGPITEPPQVAAVKVCDLPRNPEEQAWQLTWNWPHQEWRVHIDPMKSEELRAI